jgi:lipid II isoglutaminyl synthase (glutamine-hydrolysing)
MPGSSIDGIGTPGRTDSDVAIVLLYPDLLGTYGDRGNAIALAHRARIRAQPVRIIEVAPGEPVPASADIYCTGGGEDVAQVLAGQAMRADRGLRSALDGGAACLAVCAGFQLLSNDYEDGEGRRVAGLGLLDVSCGRLPEARAVGEVVAEPVALPGLPTLTGFENHQGDAVLGHGVRPLGRLLAGTGNGDGHTEGAVSGSVVATYMHGPVLVRNPGLADHLLSTATGALPPVDDELVERLRGERLRAALAQRTSGRRIGRIRVRAPRLPGRRDGPAR